MTIARVLIVDDEPLARSRLRVLLGQMSDIAVVVGDVDACDAAAETIRLTRTDIVLLDIQLREGSGFDLLDQIAPDELPVIVFVTAYDTHAVQAFEVGAVDYVLKPVRPERLRQAIERALEARERSADERLSDLRLAMAHLKKSAAGAEDAEFWVRRANGDLVRIVSSAIDWAHVEDNYVRLHVGSESYLIRESIRGLTTRLASTQFMQVHRTAIVRVDAVSKVSPDGNRLLDIELRSGTKIKAGRVYAKALRQKFRQS